MSNLLGSRLRHGHGRKSGRSPEYKIWMGMRSRCRNPNSHAFGDYAGRGIDVCAAWDDFKTFLADMGPRPSADHSLDRIDNSRGYEPGNVRWATWIEQQRNRRSNRVLTAFGVTAPLAELCERFGCKYGTVHMRLTKGATPEHALQPGRIRYGSLPLGGKDALNG